MPALLCHYLLYMVQLEHEASWCGTLPKYLWFMNAELETEAIAALEQEMKALKDDRAQVSKLRTQLEQASVRMEQEKAAWKRQQVRL